MGAFHRPLAYFSLRGVGGWSRKNVSMFFLPKGGGWVVSALGLHITPGLVVCFDVFGQMAGWSSEVKSQALIFKGPPGFSRPSGHINRQAQLAAGAGSQEGTRRAATTGIGLQLGYGPGLSPVDDRGAAQCQAAAHSRTIILMAPHMAGPSPSPFSSAMAFLISPSGSAIAPHHKPAKPAHQ